MLVSLGVVAAAGVRDPGWVRVLEGDGPTTVSRVGQAERLNSPAYESSGSG